MQLSELTDNEVGNRRRAVLLKFACACSVACSVASSVCLLCLLALAALLSVCLLCCFFYRLLCLHALSTFSVLVFLVGKLLAGLVGHTHRHTPSTSRYPNGHLQLGRARATGHAR